MIWKVDGDLPRFKKLTMGHPIIMGRKTFESIGKALPGRTNIVITHNSKFIIQNCQMANSLEQALAIAKQSPGNDEIFIIGGGEIYKQALPLTNRLYLTLVESDEPGDTFFPEYSEFGNVVSEESFAETEPPHRLVILERLE